MNRSRNMQEVNEGPGVEDNIDKAGNKQKSQEVIV